MNPANEIHMLRQRIHDLAAENRLLTGMVNYYTETLCVAGDCTSTSLEGGGAARSVNKERVGAVLAERDILRTQLSGIQGSSKMVSETINLHRHDAANQKAARQLAERRLEIATDLLRDAVEVVRNANVMDESHADLLRRIEETLGTDHPECGAFGQNCRMTNDPHDGTPVCMTCDARLPETPVGG